MSGAYIPYETLAQAEAQDMVVDGGAVAALGLDPARLWALREILAATFAQGLEMGVSLSGNTETNPMTVIEAYNAGVADALEKGC